MFQKCISKEIIYKYSKLLNSLNGSFVTNMKTSKLTSLIRMQLDDMAKWTITSNSLTGTDSSNYTYSYSSSKLYVMEPNEDSITEAHDLIESVYNGEVLEDSYKENTGSSHTVTKTNPNQSTITTPKKDDTKKDDDSKTIDTSKTITSSTIDNNSNTSTVTPPEDDNKTDSKDDKKDTDDKQEQVTSSTIEEDNKDKKQTENNYEVVK